MGDIGQNLVNPAVDRVHRILIITHRRNLPPRKGVGQATGCFAVV